MLFVQEGKREKEIIFNRRIAEAHPVVLLIDLDNDECCAPLLIKKLVKDKNKDW